MNISLASTTVQIIGRVIAAAILIPRYAVAGISYSCLIGWIIMLAFEIPCYFKVKRIDLDKLFKSEAKLTMN